MTLLMRDRENIERGRQEGLAEGMEKGMERGLAEGLEKGRNRVICDMLRNGMSCETIARIMKAEVEEIRKLQRRM